VSTVLGLTAAVGGAAGIKNDLCVKINITSFYSNLL
jgi:hypothetical protein